MSAITGVTGIRVYAGSDSTSAEITVERTYAGVRVSQPRVADLPDDLRAALLAWLGGDAA